MGKKMLVLTLLLSVAAVSLATDTPTLLGWWKFDNENSMGYNSVIHTPSYTSYNVWGGFNMGIGHTGDPNNDGSFDTHGGIGYVFYGGQSPTLLAGLRSTAITYDFWVKGRSDMGFMTHEGLVLHGEIGTSGGASVGYANPIVCDINPVSSPPNGIIAWANADEWCIVTKPTSWFNDTFNDTWAHVVIKFDYPLRTETITVNGVLLGSAAVTHVYTSPSYVQWYFSISGRTWGDFGWRGEIDDFKIYVP